MTDDIAKEDNMTNSKQTEELQCDLEVSTKIMNLIHMYFHTPKLLSEYVKRLRRLENTGRPKKE